MEASTVTNESSNDNYRFKLNQFEGPLDLLLFLIKKSEINIYDIPIAQITEQYLEYLNIVEAVNLDNITEFYVMAATLLYIKSRMLLPVEVDFDDELEDPRQELVDRLIEYQKYKKISELMMDKENESEWAIERKKKQRVLPFDDKDDLWDKIDVWELLKTFSSLISNISSERILNLYEEVSINEKISLVNELLEEREYCLFTDLVIKENSIMEIICAFLAILELVKLKRISIYQNRMFGDIRIYSHPDAGKEDEYPEPEPEFLDMSDAPENIEEEQGGDDPGT
ncbi:segregation/condensation protein A [Marispirochaeta aestuarii]|uniref:segregation and condensation protein A n=1 Tax=Marispirochaeta aestuarii TaxID=1963862 RepID=UPI002ABDB610|nr:segregation/condensation protein A [Marispirochaeta aestuarii]